jgi:hypothetical protein
MLRVIETKFVIFALLAMSVSACSMQVSMLEYSASSPSTAQGPQDSRVTWGEVKTTPEGLQIEASFGEVAEKKILGNGLEIEGAFYE